MVAYQREWAWIDKQNYRDFVDAQNFNIAFHSVEGEFDKIAQTLGGYLPLSGYLPKPAYDSGYIWMVVQQPNTGESYVDLTHGLNSTDLFVHLEYSEQWTAPRPGRTFYGGIDLPTFLRSTTGDRLFPTYYITSGEPNVIHLRWRLPGDPGPSAHFARVVRVRIWKY